MLAAITKLKHRKAAGLDNISAEEIQAATQRSGLTAVHRLCSMAWKQEQIPSDWKSAVIIPVHKKKDTLDCSNYTGISPLCHCSKIFSWIILQRIKSRTEEILTEALQAGFRTNRSTIDHIFTLRQLAETYDQFGKELYVCYIDFRKAFDSVRRKGLWKVLRHYGYSEKIIYIYIIRILENV